VLSDASLGHGLTLQKGWPESHLVEDAESDTALRYAKTHFEEGDTGHISTVTMTMTLNHTGIPGELLVPMAKLVTIGPPLQLAHAVDEQPSWAESAPRAVPIEEVSVAHDTAHRNPVGTFLSEKTW
jgi:hypothetical protein